MAEFNRDALRTELERDEGRKSRPYYDTVGKLTIGVGHLLQGDLPDDVIDLLLERDIDHAVLVLDHIEPTWTRLDDTRRRVLLNLAFNMGPLRLAGFKKFWAAARDFIVTGSSAAKEQAAVELESSLWYQQVGERAKRLVAMWRDG